MAYFLFLQGDIEYSRFLSKQGALDYFRSVALELDMYGQRIEATLHKGHGTDYSEYPDYILSLGPRRGLKVEAT